MVALSFARVEWSMVGVMGLAQCAAVVALLDKKLLVDRGSRRFAAGVAIMAIVTLAYIFHPPIVRLSQYKGLSLCSTFLTHMWWPSDPALSAV